MFISNSRLFKPVVYLLILFLVFFFSGCSSQIDEKEVKNEKHSRPVIVIHGGAGGSITRDNIPPEKQKEYEDKLTEALNVGYTILENGGSGIEAVIKTIQVLEESPLFNAGIGAVFTNEGKIELDASIMDGSNGMAGAVAGVSLIKSPIEAAYHVMINSPHVMMSGKGAEKFAELNGLELVDTGYFFTEKRYEQLRKMRETKKDKKHSSLYLKNEDFKYGTVGVVALDKNGNLAAGTSTGGMMNKQFGRIGDSPIIGAGTYANNNTCAVSATGHGEFFIRNVVAYDIAARMKYQDKDLKTAAGEVIDDLQKINGFGGVICLDKYGNIAMPFNTEGMFRGYMKRQGEPVVEMFKKEE